MQFNIRKTNGPLKKFAEDLNISLKKTFRWPMNTWKDAQHWSLFSSVQLLSDVWLWDPMNHSMPALPVHHQLSESTQTHVHWVGDAIQPSYPLSSPSPPSLNPSQHQGLFQCQFFASGGQSIGVSASTSVLPMNRMDWLDLLAVLGTLKSLLQHHSSKVSILWCSVFL